MKQETEEEWPWLKSMQVKMKAKEICQDCIRMREIVEYVLLHYEDDDVNNIDWNRVRKSLRGGY